MDWGDLPFFLAVARHGTLARAAKALRTDPTTAGRRVQKLERALGARLFEHSPGGHVLTAAGERLLAKARAMDRLAAEAQAAGGAGAGASPLTGTVRLSVAEGLGSWFVARRIGAFSDAHPAVTVDLVANSGFLSPSKREADIAVVLSRPKAGPVIARKLSDYALRLYASPAYLAATGMPEGPPDLARGHRLVGYIPDLLYAPELRYLDEIHPGLAATIRSSSINAQQRLLAQGAGIGVLPCFIGDADPALRPVLPGQRIMRSFWIVTHKDTHNLARVRAGTKWLVEAAARHRALMLPD